MLISLLLEQRQSRNRLAFFVLSFLCSAFFQLTYLFFLSFFSSSSSSSSSSSFLFFFSFFLFFFFSLLGQRTERSLDYVVRSAVGGFVCLGCADVIVVIWDGPGKAFWFVIFLMILIPQ